MEAPTEGRSPAFRFYPGDYLADANVQMMTLEQEGAYIRLLCYCWRQGDIPGDPWKISRLCKGCSLEVAQAIAEHFIPHPTKAGFLIHARLEIERRKQAEYRDRQSKYGKGNVSKGSKGDFDKKEIDLFEPTDVKPWDNPEGG